MLLAVIDHLVVDLVRHHRHIGEVGQPCDELVDLRLRRHAACGVGGRVDDQQPRPRRDQGEGLLGREGEAVLLADRHRDRRRAGVFDHRAVNRKAGVRIQDLGAGLAEHQDRHEHGDLAAGHDHHALGRDLDGEALVQIGGHGLAQRQDAVGRRVAVVAVAQGLHRRLDDMLRRREIRLADAEIDDVLALPLQFGGARQHGEGVFLADAGEGGGDMKGHDGLDVSVSNGLHAALATVFAGKRAGMQARPTSGPCRARMKNSMIYRDKAPCGRPERAG